MGEAGRRLLIMAAARQELGDLDGEVVGVGPVLAAARAATLIERARPERVVLVGTAGAYGSAPTIGSAVIAGRVGLSYGIAAMGLGYVPRHPTPVDCDPDMLEILKGAEVVNVLTVGAITTDLELAERLCDGWSVEHLEAFGVALACREAGVPFVASLGISNRVGPDAHIEWLTHRDAAQEAARQAIAPLVAAAAI